MIGRESPHDHWADMGLDEQEPAPRFDPVTGANMKTKSDLAMRHMKIGAVMIDASYKRGVIEYYVATGRISTGWASKRFSALEAAIAWAKS